MDGRNSFGRRISLLNETSEDSGRAGARHPSLAFRHSRTSSYASTPNSSPPTPQLVRSDSSDSSAMNRTPSPVTPSFDFNGIPVAQKPGDPVFSSQAAFFSPQQTQPVSSYPLIPQHAAHFNYPAPPAIAPQPSLYAPPPPASDVDSHSQQSASSKTVPKKNQYPCPLAKQYNCHDFFTTSGHAARHAKKHTGKKDAFCPECNKAFTRKDNMEQHRRTHQNGRNSTKSGGESQSKRQKTSSQLKRSSTAGAENPSPMQGSIPALDPSLPQSPASSFGYPEPVFPQSMQSAAQPYPLDLLQQSPYPQNTPYPLPGPYDPALAMTGLDTLAIAAAKRDPDF